MAFVNSTTGEEFEDEDDYLRSQKQDDSYELTYDYEYITNRYGEGDDDVDLANATLNVSLTWDDSSAPGYTVSYTVDSPTPLPNEWTHGPDGIFSDMSVEIVNDLGYRGVSPEVLKDWPL